MALEIGVVEFSLQTQADFVRPCLKVDANLVSFVRQVAGAFGEFLDLQGVVLSSNDDLFGYTLTLPMFKGSAEIVLKPHSITVAFGNGRNLQALDLMIRTTCQFLDMVSARGIRQSRISISGIARFNSLDHAKTYTSRFENREMGVTGGGVVFFATGGSVEGEGRIIIEKTMGEDGTITISATMITPVIISAHTFECLGQRLLDLTRLHGLNLVLN